MYILNCTQSISHHLPEGRRLKAAVVTLVAFGALSILLGTLATLSMQGVLRTTLAAVSPEGVISLVSGGFLIMFLGQCLYAARKGYVGQRVSFTHSEANLIFQLVTDRLSEEKSPYVKGAFMLDKEAIHGCFFMKYEQPLTGYSKILEAAHAMFRKENCEDHFIAPIEIAKLRDDVEVAVFVENPSERTLIQQQDRYLHFQQGDDHRVYFEDLLRLICKENLSVPKNLADFFPLSDDGKVILLHLEKAHGSKQEHLQHFFDAMPTRWYTALQEVLKQEWEYTYADRITGTLSKKREKEHREFQKFLEEKKITRMSDPVIGSKEDPVVRKLNALLKRPKPLQTLIYQRTLRCKVDPEKNPEELAECFEKLFLGGVIHSFEQNGESFTVRC